MKKIPVVYWSGTGNTKIMAEAVAEAVNKDGNEALLYSVGETTAADIAQYDAIAFGCPSMGVEVLEEYEFEPFFAEIEGLLQGKKVALFGSYGWGGTYMQDWEARVKNAGAELVADGVLAMGTPDAASLEACAALAHALNN